MDGQQGTETPGRERDSLFCAPLGFGSFNPVLALVSTARVYPAHRAFICVSDKGEPQPRRHPPSSGRLLRMCSLGPQSNLHPHVLKHSENPTANCIPRLAEQRGIRVTDPALPGRAVLLLLRGMELEELPTSRKSPQPSWDTNVTCCSHQKVAFSQEDTERGLSL